MTGRSFGSTGYFSLGSFQPMGDPAGRYTPARRSAPRRQIGQAPICCQAAPDNKVVCSSGYYYNAN